MVMSPTPLQELINLRWYIQHIIHESGYLYDDDESNYRLSEDNLMLQTHVKFIDRIPSTTPGAEPPRDAKDSGSARPHSTHLETSSTNRS